MKSSIRIDYGNITISFEGSEEFIERVFPKIVSEIGMCISEMPAAKASEKRNSETNNPKISLPELIKKQTEDTHVRRFLVTAAWLQTYYDQDLSTGMVVKKLKETRQLSVGNASDCLNSNVQRGFCEKIDKTFFVTPSGLDEVGIAGYI